MPAEPQGGDLAAGAAAHFDDSLIDLLVEVEALEAVRDSGGGWGGGGGGGGRHEWGGGAGGCEGSSGQGHVSAAGGGWSSSGYGGGGEGGLEDAVPGAGAFYPPPWEDAWGGCGGGGGEHEWGTEGPGPEAVGWPWAGAAPAGRVYTPSLGPDEDDDIVSSILNSP
jgi:hypothetical protein